MNKSLKKIIILSSVGIISLSAVACGGGSKSEGTTEVKTADTAKTVKLDPSKPTNVTVWNYYNGDQLAAFETLVSEFNDTVGSEMGIIVTSVSQGSIDNLATCLNDALSGKVGAQDVPTMASIYSETAYELEKEGYLVNLDDYFTTDELDQYIQNFISEGRMTEDGDLVIFPVSKSTECFVANETDWKAFEDATQVSISSITSIEKLVEAAEKYYEWTDSLTPDLAEDGKALYGRDSVSNYVFVGAKELKHELFTVDGEGVKVDMDKATFRKLWDNYYVPFIQGYFTKEASYRSEDMKTGKILALTGSTSGINYVPTAVTASDDTTHDITVAIEPQLLFEGADAVSVQQGAGYGVMKSSEEEEYAAVEFLKWFTDAERNLTFSANSGYSPVKVEANDVEKIKANFAEKEDTVKNKNIMESLIISSEIFENQETFNSRSFDGIKEIRDLLGNTLSDTASADRAKVVEAIASGTSRSDATAPFMTDEYFDSWYNALVDSVNSIIAK